jgi:hypothetical protein
MRAEKDGKMFWINTPDTDRAMPRGIFSAKRSEKS